MKRYRSLFEGKISDEEVESIISHLEDVYSNFISIGMDSNDLKKLAELWKSKKYKFMFKIYNVGYRSDGSDKVEQVQDKISIWKKKGWKVFYVDENVEDWSVVFYKIK